MDVNPFFTLDPELSNRQSCGIRCFKKKRMHMKKLDSTIREKETGNEDQVNSYAVSPPRDDHHTNDAICF